MYLKLQPYKQKFVVQRPFQKLAARYYGPFQIIHKIGEVANKLQLPETTKINPIFHVSQLKKAIGEQTTHPTLLAQLTEELELKMEPERILGVRNANSREGQRMEVLVKWKEAPEFDSTREAFENIQNLVPKF